MLGTPEERTEAVVLLIVVGGCLWTLASGLLYGQPATISAVIAQACQRHPILAFGLGLLVGHWIWPLSEGGR